MYSPIKIDHLQALHDHVIVSDMEFSERVSSGGIILKSDDMKTEGVRPRWGKVYAIGPDQSDVKIGQWILVSHGRWTRGVKITGSDNVEVVIRRVDNKDIIAVSDEIPQDDTIGLSDPT